MCWLLMKKCSITELFIVNELNIVWKRDLLLFYCNALTQLVDALTATTR